jgi:uncharacterized protein (DUF2235 family)
MPPRRRFLVASLGAAAAWTPACSTAVRPVPGASGEAVNKTIIYCLDGTWNGTSDDHPNGSSKASTNVYRLFMELLGSARTVSDAYGALRTEEKRYSDGDDGAAAQLALYCHGVGASVLNAPMHILGGVLGAGLTTRIRQGYSFISRNYTAGDRTVLVGFSRGAYGIRALADMIARQGLLKRQYAAGHDTLSHSAGAWLRYRKAWPGPCPTESKTAWVRDSLRASEAAHRIELATAGKLPGENSFVPARVRMVAVFDTVGAMGWLDESGNRRIDDFGFVSPQLAANIDAMCHVVSLDEQRRDYTPSLLLDSDRLKQILFPGAHADIGGGYADDHALADTALLWMFRNLQPVVRFASDAPRGEFSPDPLGLLHTPWRGLMGIDHSPRDFSGRHMIISRAVRTRMAVDRVPAAGEEPARYAPVNLPEPGLFEEERPP